MRGQARPRRRAHKQLTLTVQKQLISYQGLLESRAHERIATSRFCEDGKVYPEEE